MTSAPLSGPADLAGVSAAAWDWIDSVAVPADGGAGWLEDGELFDDLYSGTAGVLLGCAEAAGVGPAPDRVAGPALGRLRHLVDHPASANLPDDGLFSGWSGVAAALRAWSLVAVDADAAAAAETTTERIAERVLDSAPDPDRCTDVISGEAGTLIALLAGESSVAARAAGVLADRLVAKATPVAGGLQWHMDPTYVRLMPGFSHGTAGIAFALARAAQRLDRADLLASAIQGAEALLAVGHTPSGWALPLTIPPEPNRPPVYFGWCHGPAGTIRLFLTLDAIDPQPRWQRAVEACIRAVLDSGLPQRLYPGFWDNVARCCGTAGVGQMMLERYLATGDAALLGFVDRLAADVVDRTVLTASGMTWQNTEYTRTPTELPAEAGFMQGAAGIAGWLARVHAAHGGRATTTGDAPSWC